ncbi:unnamed protein product [Mesocestoides corti]|nr:unnamed protein product [Mesocestoides corti]
MDAFLMDCPPDYELNDWARHLSSYAFTLAVSRCTASVVCSINVSETASSKYTWASGQVQEAFEFCATTCVRFKPAEKSNQLEAEFWHRRTADSIYRSVKQPATLVPSNKPAISANCQITVCPKTHALLNCSVISSKVDKGDAGGSLPSSTFNLTPSEREIEERKKVVLPYKTAANVQLSTTISSLPENTIEYDPDAFDDIDDDDPDDDLDI